MAAIVYVIDDDEGVRNWAMAVAEEMGCRTVGFASAEAFLAAPAHDRPSCVVLDLVLHGMSGVELLDELQKLDRHVSAVAYTGRAQVADAVRLMESGALTLLQKPCSVETLADAVQKALVCDAKRLAVEKEASELRGCLAELKPRARAVLQQILLGKLNKAIARELSVSERTVENDRAKVYKTFGVDSVAQLAVKCTKLQMLTQQDRPCTTPRLAPVAAVADRGAAEAVV